MASAPPDFTAGQKITAGMLRSLVPTLLLQGFDLTVTNSAVPVDTALQIEVEPGAIYKYALRAAYTSNDTADATFVWSGPPGGIARRFTQGLGLGGTGGAGDFSSVSMRRTEMSTPINVGGGTTSTTISYYEIGQLIGGSTTVPFVLQFAQSTADPSDTVLQSSSQLEYQRIE